MQEEIIIIDPVFLCHITYIVLEPSTQLFLWTLWYQSVLHFKLLSGSKACYAYVAKTHECEHTNISFMDFVIY